jgi:[acyl-carrier-protein] S-malonyltransferase
MNETAPSTDSRVPGPDFRVPNLAFIFPGQGSQSLGMLAELSSEYAIVKATFDEASAGAGVDLWA